MKTKHCKLIAPAISIILAIGAAQLAGCVINGQKAKTPAKQAKRPAKTPTPRGFKTYVSDVGWQVSYPKDWSLYAPTPGMEEVFLLDIRPDPSDYPGIVIHSREVPSNNSLRENTASEKTTLQKQQGYEELSYQELEINGIEAVKLHYLIEKDGQTLEKLQIWLQKNSYGLIIIGEATKQDFGKYSGAFEKIIESVQMAR